MPGPVAGRLRIPLNRNLLKMQDSQYFILSFFLSYLSFFYFLFFFLFFFFEDNLATETMFIHVIFITFMFYSTDSPFT